MFACPTEDQLLRYARRPDNESDLVGMLAHVESCASCRQRLENLARATPRNSTVAVLPEEPRPEADEPVRAIALGGENPIPVVPESIEPSGSIDHRAPAKGTSPVANEDRRPIDPFATVPGRDNPDGPPGERFERSQTARPFVPGYEIIDRLGEGGMGVVYKARQLGLNRLVALKMIREDRQLRKDYLARFLYEAEAVARLRHPNIIQIYDIGEAGGLPFVALELLEGGSLQDRLAGNPQAGEHAAELMVPIARAVHVAHLAGIIHRDLKPSNVLVTAEGVPKISDFGLAKGIDRDSVVHPLWCGGGHPQLHGTRAGQGQ